MHHSRKPATLAAGIAIAALALGLTACAPGTDSEPAGSEGSAISAERCAQNEAAGKITYLTGYYYQASASILEYVAADKLGYFDDLCLDVEIQPGTGDTGQNTQLLASDKVQFSAVSQQDLILAQQNGIDVEGISSYSNVGLEILMTDPSITDLKQLNGTILGQKGNMPSTVQAMLVNAGADFDSIEQVVVGYDPTVLTRGQVNSLTGFISNEPNLLAAAGEEVTVWRPYDFDVPGSLGAMAVNPAFADENPTAVEDFLRAGLHAFDYCSDNAEECVGYAADLSGADYDTAHNVKVWETEVGVVNESAVAGVPLGTIDTDNVTAIAELLNEYDLASTTPEDAAKYFDGSFVEAIYDGDALVWPAP